MKTESRRNRDRIIFVAALALALAMLACESFSGAPASNPNSGIAGSSSCLSGIVPGQTSRAQVRATLGDPLSTEQTAGLETMFYASAIYGQLNSIVVQNDVVILLSVIQPEDSLPKWTNIKTQYGTPTHTAYSNYSEGTKTFAFPEQGLSFIVDENMNVVFIQNCFIPMSLENYMIAYGNFLPSEDPFVQ